MARTARRGRRSTGRPRDQVVRRAAVALVLVWASMLGVVTSSAQALPNDCDTLQDGCVDPEPTTTTRPPSEPPAIVGDDYCTPDVFTSDQPDAVAGAQVHWVYVHPADRPDRSAQLRGAIQATTTRFLSRLNQLDPMATIRFDTLGRPGSPLAGCLDITTVRAQRRLTDLSTPGQWNTHLEAEVRNAFAISPYKRYVVLCDCHGNGGGTAGVGGQFAFVLGGYFTWDATLGFANTVHREELGDIRGGSGITPFHEMLHSFGAYHLEEAIGGVAGVDDWNDIMNGSWASRCWSEVNIDARNDRYWGRTSISNLPPLDPGQPTKYEARAAAQVVVFAGPDTSRPSPPDAIQLEPLRPHHDPRYGLANLSLLKWRTSLDDRAVMVYDVAARQLTPGDWGVLDPAPFQLRTLKCNESPRGPSLLLASPISPRPLQAGDPSENPQRIQPGATYELTVRARDAAGNTSDPATARITVPSTPSYQVAEAPRKLTTVTRYLRQPRGLAADRDGNVLVAESGANTIRRFDPRTNAATPVVGTGSAGYSGDGGPAADAMLRQPYGVAVDSEGNLYVADTGNNVVRRVDARTGLISTVAGTGTAGNAGLGGRATDAQLDRPESVAVDADGNVYVADTLNWRVVEVAAADGHLSLVAGAGAGWYSPFDPVESGPATGAHLWEPSSVALDRAGNLLVGDRNNLLRRVDRLSGRISTVAGNGSALVNGDWGRAVDAQVGSPTGLALDAYGNVIVAVDERVVRRISASNGRIAPLVCDGACGPHLTRGADDDDRLFGAQGVAVDPAGNVYIADLRGSALRRLGPAEGKASDGLDWPEPWLADWSGLPQWPENGTGTGTGTGIEGAGGDDGPSPEEAPAPSAWEATLEVEFGSPLPPRRPDEPSMTGVSLPE